MDHIDTTLIENAQAAGDYFAKAVESCEPEAVVENIMAGAKQLITALSTEPNSCANALDSVRNKLEAAFKKYKNHKGDPRCKQP